MREGDKMIHYVKMDIFESPAQVLVNTVNTVGVMGKGIAKQYKQLYPEMFREYQKFCEKGLLGIGKLWIYKTDKKWIMNFPTKKHWRNPSRVEYIESGLEKFVKTYQEKGIRSISFPPLGCGNGGLDWDNVVKPLMEKYLKGLDDIEIFIHVPMEKFELKQPEFKSTNEIKQWLNSEPNSLSVIEVWRDLSELAETSGSIPTSTMIYNYKLIKMSKVEDEVIIFESIERSIQENITFEDISFVWGILRNQGLLSPKQLKSDLFEKQDFLFRFLSQLSYVEPMKFLNEITEGTLEEYTGIRLVPSNSNTSFQGELEL